ncbi:hypothetical protein MMC25_006120 [Agyrium rufum]|nr:hypothetical protein [Agyrium rufum]
MAKSSRNPSPNHLPSPNETTNPNPSASTPFLAPPNPSTHPRIPRFSFSWPGRSSEGRSQSNDPLEQEEMLRSDEEQPDEEDYCGPNGLAADGVSPCPPNPHAHLPVYGNIHRIRRDMIQGIDDPYSLDQLKAPRMNLAIIRPLVDRYHGMDDISIIYCLLVNKVQFMREHSNQPHHQSVNITRATVCELVANRVLRRFNEDNLGHKGLLLLSNILVAGFEPFQGAPETVILENGHALQWLVKGSTGYERTLTALEVAIISKSKTFLSSSASQRVIHAIYVGRVTYSPTAFVDILPDHYKRKAISLYDPRKGPLLNQYRLVVPRTRNVLEVVQFVVLLALYVWLMEARHGGDFTVAELFFSVYAAGWSLDQFASILEHGWGVYTQNLWSFLDVFFIGIYAAYLVMRLRGLSSDYEQYGLQALDILATGAPILIPRLGFNLMSENMLFVSLRAMMADFTVLTGLAVWCFGGFLLALKWLGTNTTVARNGIPPILSMVNPPASLQFSAMEDSIPLPYHEHETITISKWMLWVWFGLDGTGIQRSVDFHRVLGPILMVTFAFLGNTLFLTILVSMLSNTFASIVANATAEIQFRRAVLTFEGVKSDAIFAYQPPFNILAVVIMLPLKFVLSPRWFHKCNVTAVRVLNAPLLLLIGLYERRNLWTPSRRSLSPKSYHDTSRPSLKHKAWWWERLGISRLTVHGDIQAVFDAEPSHDDYGREHAVLDNIPEEPQRQGSASQILAESFQAPLTAPANGSTIAPPTGAAAGATPSTTADSEARSGSTTLDGSADHRSLMHAHPHHLHPPPSALSHHPTHQYQTQQQRSRRMRKESVDSFAGLREHLPELSQHIDGGERELLARLESLEQSNRRIESLLGRLCEDMEGKVVGPDIEGDEDEEDP